MNQPRSSPYKAYLGASAALGIATFAALTLYLPHLFMGLRAFMALTVTAFILMGFDKRISGSRVMRVPEHVLWGLAAIGGSLGMFLGMQVFRHKTKKSSLQIVLLGILVVQLMLGKLVANHLGIHSLRELLRGGEIPY